MCPVVECPETNSEYHSWYKGEADFSAADSTGKLIKVKPMGEICCFMTTMYLYAV